MIVFLEQAFVSYIYQPFFNILVGIYWTIGELIGEYDMGLAVILFAIVVRFIMLPLNFAGDRSAKEKKEISDQIKKLNKEFRLDPVKLKTETKKIMKSNPQAIISETITLFIQLIIIFMLYRIFKTGLEGDDLHLLYDFMPKLSQPVNLIFLGKINLAHTSFILNTIQSILIFVLEMLQISFNPLPTSRKEFLSLAIFLPLASFLVFALLPSGKKLFIITYLVISIFIILIKQAIYWYNDLFAVASNNSGEAIPSNKE